MSKSTLRSVLLLGLTLLANQVAVATPAYTFVTNATNNSAPSIWTSHSFDISSLIADATQADLSFDLRNDAPNPPFIPDPTTSEVLLGIENFAYFVHFNYVSDPDTSHWRNVQLNIDGLIYVDQYGAFNDHLGDDISGTAQQGNDEARNILGERGFDASTYIMSPVPIPAAAWFFVSGIAGLFAYGRKTRSHATKS